MYDDARGELPLLILCRPHSTFMVECS